MKNKIVIFLLLLLNLNGFSQAIIVRTLDKASNTADSLKPISKATQLVINNINSTISNNATLTNTAITTANSAVSIANTANIQGVRMGAWNALTNTPALTSDASAISAGGFYDVTVAGTSSITGTGTVFNIGDRLAKVGSVWVRLPFNNNVPLLFKSDDIIATINYITYPSGTTTFTNTSGVLAATASSNYGVVTTALESNNIVYNFQDWVCIGYNSAGLPIVLSLDSQRGKIQTITSTGTLGGSNGTVYFSSVAIPSNAIIRITNNSDRITIHYSTDSQATWTFWAEAVKTTIGVTLTKFGALSLFPITVLSINYSNNNQYFTGSSINESTIIEGDVLSTDRLLILSSAKSSGVKKKSIADVISQFQTKNIILKAATPLTFQGAPVLGEYTYASNVISATGGNFSNVISAVDVESIILENTAQMKWVAIGQDASFVYILSLKNDNIGNVLRVDNAKGLSGITPLFPTTAIPATATRIKVDVSSTSVVVSTTTDNVNYVIWGSALKSAISSTYMKRLGVLNLSGAITVYSAVPSVNANEVNNFAINGNNLQEISSPSDFVLLLNSAEPSGARKKKVSDLFSQFGNVLPDIPVNFTKIIATGTSITAGVGATGASSGTAKWVSVAQQGLTDALGRTITIINGGVSGQTSSGMLSNLPALLSANPDASIVVIETAINDAKTTAAGGISIATTKSNIQAMITLVKNAGMIPVLSTPAPLDMSITSVATDFDNAKRTSSCFVTISLAKSNNIRCADINRFMSQNMTLLGDGLHPNDKGHLAWANIICSEILK